MIQYKGHKKKPMKNQCEICAEPMTQQDYDYCDICGNCLE